MNIRQVIFLIAAFAVLAVAGAILVFDPFDQLASFSVVANAANQPASAIARIISIAMFAVLSAASVIVVGWLVLRCIKRLSKPSQQPEKRN